MSIEANILQFIADAQYRMRELALEIAEDTNKGISSDEPYIVEKSKTIRELIGVTTILYPAKFSIENNDGDLVLNFMEKTEEEYEDLFDYYRLRASIVQNSGSDIYYFRPWYDVTKSESSGGLGFGNTPVEVVARDDEKVVKVEKLDLDGKTRYSIYSSYRGHDLKDVFDLHYFVDPTLSLAATGLGTYEVGTDAFVSTLSWIANKVSLSGITVDGVNQGSALTGNTTKNIDMSANSEQTITVEASYTDAEPNQGVNPSVNDSVSFYTRWEYYFGVASISGLPNPKTDPSGFLSALTETWIRTNLSRSFVAKEEIDYTNMGTNDRLFYVYPSDEVDLQFQALVGNLDGSFLGLAPEKIRSAIQITNVVDQSNGREYKVIMTTQGGLGNGSLSIVNV